ncbi:succinoglycan biosynthesis protein exop, partial [Mesorhizobium sp. M7A.F.Ca.CA.004.11.2.1]
MVDRENREDWKRERSLLALGQAVRGDEPDASLVSIGDRADPSWREDAATRHRLARSQREARNPKLSDPVVTDGDHEQASSSYRAQTTPRTQIGAAETAGARRADHASEPY